MELRFIARSLRRRWWLVAIALFAGVVVAASIDQEQTDFRAEALVLVLPDPNTGNLYAGQPDRFVASELALMRSDGLAMLASEALSDSSVSADRMKAVTSFAQLPESDIVSITTETGDPDLSVAIANAYLETYLEQYQGRNGLTSQQLIEDLDEEVATIRASIAQIDAQLNEIAAPYIESLGTANPLPPPNLSILAPELSTERELLVTQLNRTLDYRLAAQRAVQESATSSIVQRAGDAQLIPGESSALASAAVLLGALLVGLMAAPLSFQLSDRISDPTTVAEVLGHRPVGHLPWSRSLVQSPRTALTMANPSHEQAEKRLWARIQREMAMGDGPTIVTVIGPVDRAGATTMCMALARRAADAGTRTVLLDADVTHPWLSESFVDGQERAKSHPDDPRLKIAPGPRGIVSVLAAASAVRQGVPLKAALEALDPTAELVIVDAGKVLSSAAALEATEMADIIVLTVPLGRVPEADLTDTASLLSANLGTTPTVPILPVTTRPSRRMAAPAVVDDSGDGRLSERPGSPLRPPATVEETAGASSGAPSSSR